MINYILEKDLIQKDYVVNYTNAAFVVNPKYDFKDGLFSGYNAEKRSYDKSMWAIEKDEKGIPKKDPTLQNERCVYQLLKKHYSRYDLDAVSNITGTPKEDLRVRLKREFGEDLVFWGGGVDTQKTMAFDTPDQVYTEVRERIEIFNRDGGFVFDAIHNVQGNTPVENVEAMFRAIRESAG